jgi:hypothetical protein
MSAFIVFLQAFTLTGVAFVYIAGIITGCLGNHFCNKTTVRLLSLFKGMKRSLQFFTPSLVNHPEVLRKPDYESLIRSEVLPSPDDRCTRAYRNLSRFIEVV